MGAIAVASPLAMPVLVRLAGIHKSYGAQPVLDGVDLEITDRMKVGLIGRNGSGKSTLCRIVLGREEADLGEVQVDEDRIAYLEQHDPFLPDDTVLGYLRRTTGRPEWRCGEVAGRFGLKGGVLTGPVAELSGGWRTRVQLAAMLLAEPRLLVLDEPTNFLDLRTQVTLQAFLAGWPGAALVVSHDRGFLRATTGHTAELSRGRLRLYPGPVDEWLTYRAEEQERLARENAGREAKRQQLERFVAKNRANANTASQARSKAKQLARIELHEIAGEERRVRMRLPPVPARSGPCLELNGLAIGYDGTAIATGIDLTVTRGDKVAVVGDNGAGKTTLLRTILGRLPPVAGTYRWTHGADLGYYGQLVFGELSPARTVWQHLFAAAPEGTLRQPILDLAGSFLFTAADLAKPIGVLSGGERARLVLAGLLLGRHTVLVLDEPVNHLDVETADALAAALADFTGTVLFVSHDRSFVERLATVVWEVDGGSVRGFPGDFATYLYRIETECGAAHSAPPVAVAPVAGARPGRADQRIRRDLAKRAARLEEKIADRERERADLAGQLASCTDAVAAHRLHEADRALTEEIAGLEAGWLDLQARLDGDAAAGVSPPA
jgi:ATP-binding cassette subfamily F protein 3